MPRKIIKNVVLTICLLLTTLSTSKAETEYFKLPYENISGVTAISSTKGQDPHDTINEAGLRIDPNFPNRHSMNMGSWSSSGTDTEPVWIQYDFDKLYKINQMLVWNYNHMYYYRNGFKDVLVEYSEDGLTWNAVPNVNTFNKALNFSTYEYNTVVDFNNVIAKSVRITAYSNYGTGGGGVGAKSGLSEVRFMVDTYTPTTTLTTSSTSGGSITIPGEGSFDYTIGTEVSLTATPEPHYHFVNWTGAVANPNSAKTTVKMIDNINVTANFAIDQFLLTATSSSGGSVTSPGETPTYYDYGTDVNLVATPDLNYHFTGWTGPVVNPSSATTTVKMTDNVNVKANFAINKYNLTLESSIGGSVTEPDEGTHEYEAGTLVNITASPDPNFIFKNWTGEVTDSNSATTYITINSDQIVKANFETTQTILNVGEQDPNDPNENLIESLQDAIDVIPDDVEVTIKIKPGTYYGSITLKDNLILQVSEPNNPSDPNENIFVTIVGDPNTSAIQITNSKSSTYLLEKFVILGATDGISCDGNNITLKNCIIEGNKNYGISVYDSNNIGIINCTVTGNGSNEIDGGGIGIWDNNNVIIVNTILWNNFPQNVKTWSGKEPTISYSCTDFDPLFAANGYWADVNNTNIVVEPNDPNATWIDGDYHLMSEYGRWDANIKAWIYDLDQLESPCINAGDPTHSIGNEPQPNGGIINMGAYGGTSQASKKEE